MLNLITVVFVLLNTKFIIIFIDLYLSYLENKHSWYEVWPLIYRENTQSKVMAIWGWVPNAYGEDLDIGNNRLELSE